MAKQYITYEPIDWAQGVSGGTPLNASNLNRMEDAIEELVEKVNAPITSDDIGEDAVGNAQIAADSVTSDKLAQSVRDSLSRAAYYAQTTSPVADLNGHFEGVAAYSSTTQNKPSQNEYGLCVSFSNVPGDMDAPGRWVTQIALPVSGYPVWRRKINQGSWTAWLAMTA